MSEYRTLEEFVQLPDEDKNKYTFCPVCKVYFNHEIRRVCGCNMTSKKDIHEIRERKKEV
jgi:ribosomal protein L44E